MLQAQYVNATSGFKNTSNDMMYAYGNIACTLTDAQSNIYAATNLPAWVPPGFTITAADWIFLLTSKDIEDFAGFLSNSSSNGLTPANITGHSAVTGSDFTTASAAFVAVTGMSITTKGPAIIQLTAQMVTSASETVGQLQLAATAGLISGQWAAEAPDGVFNDLTAFGSVFGIGGLTFNGPNDTNGSATWNVTCWAFVSAAATVSVNAKSDGTHTFTVKLGSAITSSI